MSAPLTTRPQAQHCETMAEVRSHIDALDTRITALLVEICGTTTTKVGPVDDQSVNLPQRAPVKLRRSCRLCAMLIASRVPKLSITK